MKQYVTILFIVFFTTRASAQNPKIDSLDNLIRKSTSDTARINLVIQKIFFVSRINLDSSISLCKRTIEEAKKINYSKGEAGARVRLAYNYGRKGDYRQAADNLVVAKNIYQSLNDSLGLSNTYSGYGMIYGMQAKYDTSIQFLETGIGIAERNSYTDKLAADYGNIALGYQMRSDFSQALLYQQKALDLAKASNDLQRQATLILNIGSTYSSMGDNTRAEQYYLQAIGLAKGDVELFAYSNLADIYRKKRELDKSYDYAMKAAALGKETGDKGMQASSLSKAARTLLDMKKISESDALAGMAVSVADSSGQPVYIFQAYSVMGAILKAQEKYTAAIPFLEKSIASLEKSDMYEEGVAEANYDLSVCYEKTGNYSKALGLYKTAAQITDSLRSRENIRRATELNMNYGFEKKQEAQRIEQKQKDAITKERQIALLIGLALTLLLAIVAFRAFRNKQKANAILKQQKEEIQHTLLKLETTQKQLIQSEKMASLGELTAGIAHEIQNPLNFVNNFSDVNTELIDEMQSELKAGNNKEAIVISNDIKENQQKITHHGKRADSIVKGMLQHSRSSSGTKELTDINKLTDEYLRLAYHGLRAKDKSFNATMKTDYDESAGSIDIIPQDVGRAILNLITNAFYAVTEKKKQKPDNYEPAVSVSTRKINDKSGNYRMEITVKDNGNGISQKALDKIFQPFFTTKPTGQGTGLGLSLSYDIIKVHGGELKVETKEGEFAAFTIILPYKS